MPGHPILEPLTADDLAALDADDRPDGHRIVVTDDGEKEYEARGADGARAWVQLHVGHVDDHEAAADPHHQYLTAADVDAAVWMPLTTVVGGVPQLVWDADGSLIPTKVPTA